MLETLLPIEGVVRLVQPENAQSRMLVTPLAMVTLLRWVLPCVSGGANRRQTGRLRMDRAR